jgi:hypothetical protein
MTRAFLKDYFDFDEKAEELSDAEKARLLWDMYCYAKTGEKKPLTGNERFLFGVFKSEIDRDIANYNAKVANGNHGGRPAMKNLTETEDNLKEPNETEINLIRKNKNREQDIKVTILKDRKESDLMFQKLWSVYPRHVGKQNAVKAFAKLKPDEALLETMINAILKQKQSAQWSDPQYIPHPATWLNGHRWEDEPTKASNGKRVLAQQYDQREYHEEEMQKILGVDDLYK